MEFQAMIAAARNKQRSGSVNPKLTTIVDKVLDLVDVKLDLGIDVNGTKMDKVTFVTIDKEYYDSFHAAAVSAGKLLLDYLGDGPWSKPARVVIVEKTTKRGSTFFPEILDS